MSERKAIFITGGGSGIGREVARHFGERGWFVGLGDINVEGMEDTEALLPGGFSYSHKLDVRDRDAWDVALDAFSTAAGGRIDVVFNNAGIAHGGAYIEQTRDEIENLIDINVKGVLFGAQAAHKHLAKTAPTAILINTASIAGIIGSPGLAAYSATKWAVRGLTESLDAEWAKEGIRVASLCPGFIDTPMIDQVQEDSNRTAKEALKESGMEVSPVSDVADVVWSIVHGDDLHYTVGKFAKKMRRLHRWLPGTFRKQMRSQGLIVEI